MIGVHPDLVGLRELDRVFVLADRLDAPRALGDPLELASANRWPSSVSDVITNRAPRRSAKSAWLLFDSCFVIRESICSNAEYS